MAQEACYKCGVVNYLWNGTCDSCRATESHREKEVAHWQEMKDREERRDAKIEHAEAERRSDLRREQEEIERVRDEAMRVAYVARVAAMPPEERAAYEADKTKWEQTAARKKLLGQGMISVSGFWLTAGAYQSLAGLASNGPGYLAVVEFVGKAFLILLAMITAKSTLTLVFVGLAALLTPQRKLATGLLVAASVSVSAFVAFGSGFYPPAAWAVGLFRPDPVLLSKPLLSPEKTDSPIPAKPAKPQKTPKHVKP